tara:strand:- start:609 stop:1334 length:726 start_codon:yes stop_codon:yes gene_type:complete
MVFNFIAHLRTINDSDKTKAVDLLIRESTGDFDFFFFIVLSVLMATLGLIANNPAIVIGSMLLAPILFPILSISLSIIMSDGPIIARSIATFLKASAAAIFTAAAATLIFAPFAPITSEILLRTEPSLIYVGVAIVAGLAVSYSLAQPALSATLPGIAVSVALIPPLATIGIGVANLDIAVISGAFTLYLVNVLGIVFSSMLIFALMNLYTKRKVAEKVVQKEEKRLEEAKEIQKNGAKEA